MRHQKGSHAISVWWLSFSFYDNSTSRCLPVMPRVATKNCDFSLFVNPFTPKSDQFQISPAASPEILQHTVWRTWRFIAYPDGKWLYYKILTASLINFSIKVGRMHYLNLGVKGLSLLQASCHLAPHLKQASHEFYTALFVRATYANCHHQQFNSTTHRTSQSYVWYVWVSHDSLAVLPEFFFSPTSFSWAWSLSTSSAKISTVSPSNFVLTSSPFSAKMSSIFLQHNKWGA